MNACPHCGSGAPVCGAPQGTDPDFCEVCRHGEVCHRVAVLVPAVEHPMVQPPVQKLIYATCYA